MQCARLRLQKRWLVRGTKGKARDDTTRLFDFPFRIIGASIGDKVVLNCDVFANPPAFRYEWKYLGNDQSKVYDPCYWEIRTNIYPCDDNEDCDYKKWEGGQWVPYDDPCGLEVLIALWVQMI